jgi:tight adherence protein C
MQMELSLVAAAAVFAAIVLGVYRMTRGSTVTAEARVRALGYGRAGSRTEGPFVERMILPVLNRLARTLLSMLPASVMMRTEGRLASAGSAMTAATFFTLVAALATLPPLAVLAGIVVISGAAPTPAEFLILIAVALVGGWLPFRRLRSRLHQRQTIMRKRLPDALDLLTLCVEAGLGLDAAFRKVSEELEGPFAEEVAQMLREVDLGKPRREALLDMATRAVVPEVGVVVNAVIQSQQMGSSLAQTLRAQSRLLRQRRRQKAEALARQAAVKMAFPLVLFLMPALFIVILGPIAVSVVRALGD